MSCPSYSTWYTNISGGFGSNSLIASFRARGTARMKKDWELLGLLVLTLCFHVNNGQKVGKATFTDRWEYSKIYIQS